MSQAGRFSPGGGPVAPSVLTLTGNTGGAVGPDGGGNIDVVGSGTISVAGNAGTNTLTISNSGAVASSFPTDVGTAVPSAGALTIAGGNNIGTVGVGSTVTIHLDGTTNHALQVGSATGALTSLAVALDGQIPIGSTGLDPVIANLTAGSGINITNGAGSITIASTVTGGIQTINGNVGSVTGTTVTLTTGASNANGTALFTGVGTTMTMTFDDVNDNLGLGTNAALFATANVASSNIAIGADTLAAVTFSGDNNLAIGVSAGESVLSGANNAFIGGTSGQDVTVGSFNVALGFNTINNLTTGNRNIVIGESSGNNYTSNESSNILIGWQLSGTAAESNVLRVGKATGTGDGELNKAFICGIDGVNVGSVAKVVTMASNQLGTATITAGTGISVTPGANTITIAATASGFTWTEVTGTSQAMAVNNGYILNNVGLVTATLPATAAVGDVVRIAGKGAGGWLLAQNASQTIFFGSSTTTPGVGGSLASTNRRDCIELICVTANNDWDVLSVQGNLTVV